MSFIRWLRAQASRLFREDSPTHVALGQLGSSALALISAPVVARLLGPEGRGETASVLAAFYIWPILSALGMQLEVRRAGARDAGEAALRRARVFIVLLLMPSAVIGWALSSTVFGGLGETRVVAFIGLALGPAMVWWMCDQSLLIARKRYRFVAVAQLVQPVTYLACVLVGWSLGVVSVGFVLSAHIAAMVFTAVCTSISVRVGLTGPRARTGSFLASSLRYSGSSIADAAANRIDQFLALPLLGAYQTGLYAVAATVGGLALPLGHALAADSFNAVASAAGDEARRAVKLFQIRTAVAGALLSGAALFAVTPALLPLIFGSEFEMAVVPALITVWGGVGAIAAYVASLVLAAEGRGVEMTIAQVIRLAVSVGALYLFGSMWGAVGAAVASALGSWVLCVAVVLRATGTPKAFLVRWSDFGAVVRRLARGS